MLPLFYFKLAGMRAVRFAVRGLIVALCVCSVVLGSAQWVSAQDDFFKPLIEAAPTKKKQQGESQIFSFGRFEGEFTTLCRELEVDGRRDRLVKIAEAGAAREKECITCRSFWKMFVSACGRLGPRPTPTPKPTKKSKITSVSQTPISEEYSQAQEGGDNDSALKETPAPSTLTKVVKQERYPSIALINEASRVSTAVYGLDSGDGQVARTFHYFASTVRGASGMSAAELEYYDVFLTYLLAAWDGRVDKTKLPTPTPSSALRDLFE